MPKAIIMLSAFSLLRGCCEDRLVVLFGEVVPDDAGGGGPSECSVGSVVIVEVDESVVGVGSLVSEAQGRM